MKNNYLVESIDSIVLADEIEKLIANNNFIDAPKSQYDLDEKELDDVFEDLDTYNFLNPKKVIIVKNIFNNFNEKKIDHLLKYLNNYNSNNLLIMTSNKIDNKLNIVKKLKKIENLTFLKLEINSNQYVKKILKDYSISNDNIQLIVDMCKNDITKINNECSKLMFYKINDKNITKEDINNLVVKKLGDSSEILFSFIKFLLLKDKKNALIEYNNLLEYNIDTNSIVGLIASQLKLIYQVKLLVEENLSNEQIASRLELKSSYQVKKMKEYSYNYTYKELANLIDNIANLDLKIKSGKVDSNLAIEIFVINL